jgi:hypothetical protein
MLHALNVIVESALPRIAQRVMDGLLGNAFTERPQDIAIVMLVRERASPIWYAARKSSHLGRKSANRVLPRGLPFAQMIGLARHVALAIAFGRATLVGLCGFSAIAIA